MSNDDDRYSRKYRGDKTDDDDKTREVESTEYDKFILSLESFANLRYNNELKLSTDGLNKEENKKI